PYEPSAELALVQGVRSSLERGYLKLSTQPLVADQVAIQPGGDMAAVGGGGLRLVKLDLTEVFTLATTATNFARVAWSADGNQLLSLESMSPGSPNNYTIRVWRDHQETAHHTFQEPIGCAEWDPDGAQIAICSGKALWLWSVNDETSPHILADELSETTTGAQWSANGRWLAAWGGFDTLIVWDRETAQLTYKRNQEPTTTISAATWALDRNDDPILAAIYGDGTVWLVSTNPATASNAAPGALESGATSSGLQKIDDAHFVTWGSTTVSRMWTNGEIIGDFGQADDNIQGVALSPSGAELLAFLANGSAKLWDISSMGEFTQTQSLKAPLATLKGHTKVIRSATWRPDGKYIATTSADGAARIWDAQTGKSLAILRGHINLDSQIATAEVFGAVWLNDRFLITYGEDGTFRRWEVFNEYGQPVDCPASSSDGLASCLNFTQLFQAHGGDITSAQWSDADTILTTDRDGNASRFDLKSGRAEMLASDDWEAPITIWNPTGTQLLTYEDPEEEPNELKSEVRDFASVETGKDLGFSIVKAIWLEVGLLLETETGELGLYDPQTFEEIANLTASSEGLTAAAISKNGELLAAGFAEGDVYIWNLTDLAASEPMAHYTPQSGVEEWDVKRLDWVSAPTGDGDRLLIVGNKAVVFWDISDDTVLIHDAPDNFADAALSPDSRWLAVADSNNVRILNMANGVVEWSPLAHRDRVQGVAWLWGAEWPHQTDPPATSERLLLLTWSGDGTARVWDWSRRELIDLLYGDGSLAIAAFSPNGKHIFTAASGGTLRTWETWIRRPEELYNTACGLITRPLSPAQIDQFGLTERPTLDCSTRSD
ncbi:MAG: hypothetical protein KDE54_07340, partial [Caldilineaceae bacterium]|nr:hypothetical protein [Caldilineaceae bacterium]